MNTMSILQAQHKSWSEALAVYRKPRVIAMIFLGFSAGLPFLLVFTTLSAWLTQAGVSRSTIGFFSWVGITYSIKVFWAPVVDQLNLPFLGKKMGKRRSWMLIAQLLIAGSLLGMAMCNPQSDLQTLALFALIVAFGSATQDIVIDAYRIEAVDKTFQGAMAATYVLGYRLALLMAGAGALFIADSFSWYSAYVCMALLMLIGITTTLIISEPEVSSVPVSYSGTQTGSARDDSVSRKLFFWFVNAVVSPFVDFFKRNGWLALIILFLIACYRISDITMGVMANPFYIDKGYSFSEIAAISKFYGFFMSILGAGLGGLMVVRYGLLKPLLTGALLVVLTNILFIYLVNTEINLISLAIVISADNLSAGIASSAFIAYLSSLTNSAYTATQYALFSSLMTLPGKVIGGFSGVVVDAAGYASFFLYSGALGLPAIVLIIYLMKRPDQTKPLT